MWDFYDEQNFRVEDGLILGDVILVHVHSGKWRHLYNTYRDNISAEKKVALIDKAKEDIIEQIKDEQNYKEGKEFRVEETVTGYAIIHNETGKKRSFSKRSIEKFSDPYGILESLKKEIRNEIEEEKREEYEESGEVSLEKLFNIYTTFTPESPKVNSLSLEEEERLYWLMEEASEVIQCCSKILRHGYESVHPDNPNGPTNRQELEKEMADYDLASGQICARGDVSLNNILNQFMVKYRRFKKGLHHFHYNTFGDENENHSQEIEDQYNP